MKKIILLIAFILFSLALIPEVQSKEFVIQNESVNMFVINGTTGNILLNPNTGFGNVGIGATTSPYNTLTVIGSVGVSGSLNASSINTTGGAYFATSSGNVGVGLINPNYLLQVASGTDGRSVNLSNVLYVNGSSGNVGIGTTTPLNPLHVIGAATFAGGVNASSLNVTGFSITDDSLVTLSDGSKKKIKDIKAGEYVKTLEEKTGRIVSMKVNALRDHGVKLTYELTTKTGRAINTTGEHPYLVELYSREECDKYAGNIWNKEADEFNGYCTRWIEVKYLNANDEIAVSKVESDLNYDNNQMQKWKGHVAQGIEPLFDSRGDAGSNFVRKSRRAHTDSIIEIEKEEKQAHSLNKALVRLTRISHEFFLDSEIAESHTISVDKDNNYKNVSVSNAEYIFFDKIASIKVLSPQHVYDLSIEGTRNFIANDIVAHNTYLATSSGNVGIGTTTPGEILHVIGNINVSGVYKAGPSGSASAPVYTYYNDTNTGEFSPLPDTLALTTGGTERVRIDSSGNVGIGTTSPLDKLEVFNGSFRVNNSVFFVNGSSGNVGIGTTGPRGILDIVGSGTMHLQSSSGGIFEIDFRDGVGSGATNRGGWFSYRFDNNYFTWGTKNAAGTESERMVLTREGNVGIGTTTPGSALAVVGNFSTTTGALLATSSGNVGIGTTDPQIKLTVIGGVNVTGGLNVTTGDVLLGITSGNVGIGLTNPGQKLHISGSVNVSTTLNAPVINTTLATQNLTLSSGAGSVIIRLG